MRRFRRFGWAALASLAIHLALLALLWKVEPPAALATRPSAQAPLVVEIVTRPKAAPPAKPTPAPEEPPTKPPPRRREPPAPKPPPETSAPPVPSESASPEQAPSTPSPGEVPGPSAVAGPTEPPSDAPSRPLEADGSMYPLPPSLIPGGPPPAGPKLQSGHTLRPGDPSLDPELLAAQERGRVHGRVKGFIEDNQAELRVDNGLIDSYFSRLRESLEKSLEDAPVFDGISLLNQATTSWASQAGSFGATGNPGGGPPPMAPTVAEHLKALQERGDEGMEYLRERVQAGEEMQKLAGGGGQKLIVTLELHQGIDGSLRDARLVSTSGNKAYDAYVLNGVPPALAKLGPPPDGARGVRPDGIHTLWSVEGRVVYLRKLKDLKTQDSLYMAAALAAGVLAGRFEETTGEIEVIDFRNPRFVCQAHLLRVY
ncbi:hypothetical protein [Pyxidicoccus sp. MSG2]|uniref:hypothetical protein n=1 Tax=Pyxidicoccus sp. MSG2 TaxID=2996790 RepID=UPI00226D4E7F|nr:hypothetical protein [Pyxidicoccus sp. MSG2]MCY1014231.1 hypothetical protein [Pyxidicoccus sp. MSG2]